MDIAKILVSHGANISAVDELSHTPLHRAAAFGRFFFSFFDFELKTQILTII